MNNNNSILLFSGGFDSVVTLHSMFESGFKPLLLFFNYEQKNLLQERASVYYWAGKFQLDVKEIKLDLGFTNTSIIGTRERKTEDEDKEQYIELRNLIFLSYASSIAESMGIKEIFVGIIGGVNYSDSCATFVKQFDSMLFSMTDIQLNAPFMHMGKAEIFENIKNTSVASEILSHCFSCNEPVDGKPCGKCGECNHLENFMSQVPCSN